MSSSESTSDTKGEDALQVEVIGDREDALQVEVIEDREDALQVEVIQDKRGWATVYWWKQSDEDKQVDITVTDVNTGMQNQFKSQPDVMLFYLPIRLTNGHRYTVTVRGSTSHREGEVTFHADENQVTVEQPTRTSAIVHWPAHIGQPSGVQVTLEQVTNENDTVDPFNWTVDVGEMFLIPHTLTMGQQYKVTVRGVSTDEELDTRFRAEFTRDEMNTLLHMAETFADGVVRYRPYNAVVRRCEAFYRNKTVDYYVTCYDNHSGTMKVYLKDNNGDPASIINGQVSGLFFSASVDIRTGKPFSTSIFGSVRLSIPAVTMFPTDANLYFADFYCNVTQHYVTLVLTKPGSDVDHFCQHKNLIKLDNENNKFLNHRKTDSGEVFVEVTTKLMVEVFYTENVELPQDVESLTYVPSSGTSTPGGLPKKRSCNVCNLPTNTGQISVDMHALSMQ